LIYSMMDIVGESMEKSPSKTINSLGLSPSFAYVSLKVSYRQEIKQFHNI